MKRKVLAMVLAAAMAASLGACGGSQGSGNGGGGQAPAAPAAPADQGQSSGDKAASGDEKPVTLRMASVVNANELEGRNTGMAAGLMTWPLSRHIIMIMKVEG